MSRFDRRLLESPRLGILRRLNAQAWLRAYSPLVVATLGMAFVAAAGLYHLGSKSLWLDEGFNISLSRQDLPAIWNIGWGSQGAGNMLLYLFVRHFWPFAGSEVAARSLSVVLATLTVPAMYALAARLFGRLVATWTVLLLALNAFFIHYAQEDRAYALVVLLVVLSSLTLLLALERPSRRRWVVYVVVTALALYAHDFATLIVLAHFVALLVRRPRPPVRTLVAVFGSLGLITLPLLVAAGANGASLSWWPPLSVDYARLTFEGLLGSTVNQLLPVAYVLAFLVGAVAVAVRRRIEWPLVFVGCLALVPVATVLTVSLVKPMLVDRYMIVALPGLILLATASVSSIGRRRLGTAAILVIAALSAINLRGWYDNVPKEDWRGAVAYVVAHAQPGDEIIVYPEYCRLPVDFYLHDSPVAGQVVPLYPTPGWDVYFPGLISGPSLQTVAAATEPATAKHRVWFLYRYAPPDPSTPDGQAIAALTGHQTPIVRLGFWYVGVELYDEVAPRP